MDEFKKLNFHNYKEQKENKMTDHSNISLSKRNVIHLNAPNSRHQRVISLLCYFLWNMHEIQSNIYSFLPAPTSLVIPGTIKTVQPDISIFLRSACGVLNKHFILPEIVMEIISPSNPRDDYDRKSSCYAKMGILEYWIFNFTTQSVIIKHNIVDDDKYGKKYSEEKGYTLLDVAYSTTWKNFHINLFDIYKVLAKTNELKG